MKICKKLLPILCLMPFLVFALDWEIDLPVRENNILTQELSVLTDGRVIKGVFAYSLLESYGNRFTPEFQEWVASHGPLIQSNVLAEKGLLVTLDAQNLELQVTPTLNIISEQAISIGNESSSSPYSVSTSWSWQNNFNITAEYSSESDSTASGLELNSGFNIGGYQGLNGIFRGYVDHSDDQTEFSRGSSYLFVERPEDPYRYSLGDVDTYSNGHLSVTPVGGLRIERDFEGLQPERQIKNSGSQYVELVESANVDIYVNGFRTQTLRLNPGRYDLENLPLNDGQNEVRLEINYASGETEIITYSQFYNARLLLAGLSDFGISAGLVSSTESDSIKYTDDVIVSAFYEYGVSDTLTLGANGLYNEHGYQVGVMALKGLSFGNAGLRASHVTYPTTTNNVNKTVDLGYVYSLDFSTSIWGASELSGNNLRFSLEKMQDFTSSPWRDEDLYTKEGGRMDYQWTVTSSLDLTYYSSLFWVTDANSADRRENTHNLRANWREKNWRITVGGEYVDDYNYSEDWRSFINVEYYFNLPSTRKRFSARYNGQNDKLSAKYEKSSDDYIGSIGRSVEVTRSNHLITVDGNVDYTANHWRSDLYVGGIETEEDTVEWKAKGTLANTFIIADGVTAWGRTPLGGVAIVDVHPSLTDTDININQNYYGETQSIAKYGNNSAVELYRSHQDNQITFNAPNAPIGYDIGSGVETYKPGTMTTHILKVGSDASRTVIGELQLPDQSAVSYIRGRVIDEQGEEHSFFTNKGGRFVIEGIAYGLYHIQIDGHYGEFSLLEEDDMLTYLPPIILRREQ
jgi:outer membrane usher protein